LGVASGQWFIAENRQILSFQRTMIGAAINIFLNYIFIPRFGPVGAAVATVAAQVTAAWLFDAIQSITRDMFFMKAKSLNPLRFFANFIKVDQ
jgi:PST family polysaccharide transporter